MGSTVCLHIRLEEFFGGGQSVQIRPCRDNPPKGGTDHVQFGLVDLFSGYPEMKRK